MSNEAILGARRIHPLTAIAALSVTAFSLVGIAALTGHLGGSNAGPATPVAAVAPGAAASNTAPVAEPGRATVGTPATAPAADASATAGMPATQAAASPAAPPAAPAAATASAPAARPSATHANAGSAHGSSSAASARRTPAHAATPADGGQGASPYASASEPIAQSAPRPVVDLSVATVLSITPVNVSESNNGLGAVAGGVLGGVAGHQMGGGRGRDVMTVLGAVGGAVAGNAIETHQRRVYRYDVLVRTGDGSTRTLHYSTQPTFAVGDRIQLPRNE